MVARAAQIPVIEPSDSAEAKDFFKAAFELSEQFDRPFIFRTTTRLAHSQGLVELQERVVPEDKPYVKNIQKNVFPKSLFSVSEVLTSFSSINLSPFSYIL